MQGKTAVATAAGIVGVVLTLKKALEGFTIIGIYSEGLEVAASGGDLAPYITAIFLVLIWILAPLTLFGELAEAV